jgi:hypothetical protein
MGVIPHSTSLQSNSEIRQAAVALCRYSKKLHEQRARGVLVEEAIVMEEGHNGRFVEFPPADPVVWPDEAKRTRPPRGPSRCQARRYTACYDQDSEVFENLHVERQVGQDLKSV